MFDVNTIARYRSEYNRFFKDTDFEMKSIKNIDTEDVIYFISECIKRCDLRVQGLKNLSSYLNGTFKLAKIRKYISYNPLNDIELKKFYPMCTKVEYKKDLRTISNSELEKVKIIIKDYHIRKPSYLPPYAYELASLTGTRVGEVVE